MRTFVVCLVLVVVAQLASDLAAAQVKYENPPLEELKAKVVASVFNSDMVLQRDKPVPVWGWGDSGGSVSVEFAGQEKIATVDENGKWIVTHDPMETNATGQEMTVTASHKPEPVVLKNILIGEVWICSGQSNMEWLLGYEIEGGEEAVASADYPNLRLFTVQRQLAMVPQVTCEGTWSVCSPNNARYFSAAAFYFGQKLIAELEDVPVGLIAASRGGTPVHSWTDPIGLEVLEDSEKSEDYDPEDKKNHHTPSVLFHGMIHPLIPMAIRGVIWYQGESDTTPDRLKLYRKVFPSMVNGWRTAFGQRGVPILLRSDCSLPTRAGTQRRWDS